MSDADRELEQYLAGGSRLSARYREASRETPPPALDQAMLATAREAVRGVAQRTAGSPRPRWQQRWAVPVGIAATLVVGVDLGWRVRDALRHEEASAEAAVVAMAPAPPSAVATVAVAPTATDAPASAPVATERQRGQAMELPKARVAPAEAPARMPLAAEPTDSGAASAFAPEPSVAPAAEAMPPPQPPPVASEAEAAAQADAAAQQQAEQFAARRARQESDSREDEQRASEASRKAMRAPAAAFMAEPEEPAPVIPVRSSDQAQAAAEDLGEQLRQEDDAVLRERYEARLPRQALRDAAKVFGAGLQARVSAQDDGRWRVDYVDAGGRMRCTARLRPTETGWVLEGLVTRP
ncbi:MAG TPA: hypothetical protein VFV11_00135 [Solimonas sp.]|nr:hypothetical protein [Solimonas sp.]